MHRCVCVVGLLLLNCGTPSKPASAPPAPKNEPPTPPRITGNPENISRRYDCMRNEFKSIGAQSCLPQGYSDKDLPQPRGTADKPSLDDIAKLIANEYLVSGEEQCFPQDERHPYLTTVQNGIKLLSFEPWATLTGAEYVQEEVISTLSADLAADLKAKNIPIVTFEAEMKVALQQNSTTSGQASSSGTLQCFHVWIKGAFADNGVERFDTKWNKFYPCRGKLLTTGILGCAALGFQQTARAGAISNFKQAAEAALKASAATVVVDAALQAKIRKSVERGLTRRQEFNVGVPPTFFVYGIQRVQLPSNGRDPNSKLRCIADTVTSKVNKPECQKSVDGVGRPGADPRADAPKFAAATRTISWNLKDASPIDCSCSGYQQQ